MVRMVARLLATVKLEQLKLVIPTLNAVRMLRKPEAVVLWVSRHVVKESAVMGFHECSSIRDIIIYRF